MMAGFHEALIADRARWLQEPTYDYLYDQARQDQGNQMNANVREESFQSESVTVVRLTALHNRDLHPIVVEGVAKRDEHDTNDPVTGLALARGRAYRKLGNKLTAFANERVAAADKVRRQEDARKARERSEERKRISAKRNAERGVEQRARQLQSLAQQVADRDEAILKLEKELAKWKTPGKKAPAKRATAKR